MSLLDVGKRCASCSLVDFLPTKCPHCGLIYCKDHIPTHQCLNSDQLQPSSIAGPSSFTQKSQCEKQGCSKASIEAIAGYTETQNDIDIARSVRCGGCNRSFCTEHRRQDDHDCPAPRDYNVRADAGMVRKEKAREVLSKHFPNHPAREMEKPISHTREIPRQRAQSPPRLPPSLQAQTNTEVEVGGEEGLSGSAEGKKKTKEEKMYDIHVKKIKMSAKPLDPKQKPSEGRRSFELKAGTISEEEIERWQGGGKVDGLEKVWVNETTPIGKMLDLIRARHKVTGGTAVVCLHAAPNSPRQVLRPTLDSTSSSIPDGTIVAIL